MLRIEKKLKEYNSDLFGRYETCKTKVDLLLQKYSANFPKYTDHSINHTLAVLKIVSDLLSNEEIENLNGKELYVLCMGTILHDIGMCIPEEKITDFEGKSRYTNYKNKHPEKGKEELLRDLHHELSYDFIIAEYHDLSIPNQFYAEAIALTAQAHRKVDLLDFDIYNPQFSVESGSEHICLPYLGAVLRLADELDIENSRTPDLLYKYYLPENKKSRLEWEKHRATFLVTMHSDTIRIQAKTNDQNIYHALEVQFGKVELVLEECQKIIKRITYIGEGEYALKISKIKTDIKSEFVQKNIKFSINVPNVIEILMGKNLYKSELDALRELIQNSLDSVLYKQSFGGKYSPSIVIDIYPDKIVCEDNGGGMDEYIVEKYFSKLSSSYYQSEKLSNGYNPIGKFGIGVFSYFMVSEFIEVKSKKGNATPLHFLVDKNPENYFYFYQEPTQTSEGTSITLHLNESFKEKQDLEIVRYIKETFKYVQLPLSIKIKGRELEIFNNNIQEFSLNDFLETYINKHFWNLFLKEDVIEHKFDNSVSEGSLLFFPSFSKSSIISDVNLKNDLKARDTRPIKLYNQGIFVSEIDSELISEICGVINIKKSNHISLNRTQIKDHEIILIKEEISLAEKYISKLKAERKYKAVNDFVMELNRLGGRNSYRLINKSEEYKKIIIPFFRKYISFQGLFKNKWNLYKYSQLETQNLFFIFQSKEMCLAHFSESEKLSIVYNNVSLNVDLFNQHKMGIIYTNGVYLEVLYKTESKDIIELQEEDTFAKLSSDLCFIYTGIFKDKEGDFLYSNMIFNSEYPVIKFLNSVISGQYSDYQKAFAKKQKNEFKASFSVFNGKQLRIDDNRNYYAQGFKLVSKVIDEINTFFNSKYVLSKNHLPKEAKEIVGKQIPIQKWIFFK